MITMITYHLMYIVNYEVSPEKNSAHDQFSVIFASTFVIDSILYIDLPKST